MRYLLLSLSAVLCFGWMSCKNNDNEKTIRQMSATIKRNSADLPYTWNASSNLVKAEIPFARSVRFTGSEYSTNPTTMNIFVNNYRGVGVYPIYQGSAQQTDSNSVKLTYMSREFTSITGSLEILRDDAELYIGRFSFTGSNLNDTITVTNGNFTVNK